MLSYTTKITSTLYIEIWFPKVMCLHATECACVFCMGANKVLMNDDGPERFTDSV